MLRECRKIEPVRIAVPAELSRRNKILPERKSSYDSADQMESIQGNV
jgi:hypothetical protein